MQNSKLAIRAADLTKDRPGILGVLERNLPEASAPERFEWLYCSNPDGPARVWVAEQPDGTIVGTSAGYPRRIRVDRQIVRGLVLSDFAFDAEFRSLGPALKLLKATLAPIREGEFALSYDFPSEAMHAIYLRLGATDLGGAVRLVRPLRLAGAIRRRLGDGIVSRATGMAADGLLRARDAVAIPSRAVAVDEWREPFDDRFGALESSLPDHGTFFGVRDATYLNWKYGAHTMWPHRTLVARRDGELEGFAILRAAGERSLTLLDLVARSREAARALVAGTVRLGRKHQAEQIDAEALDGSPFCRMLSDLGFVRREIGVGPVPLISDHCPARDRLADAAHWWISGGDRDI